ncbi:hypothetical protein A3Q56_00865 [Intoshia linei]|uniref:Uncharacterized protein n=1 Tax=Intoshia linei TaxID=1819745 RepID=A0A177BCH2_9BILA|nr:hypothetical protein A3Q56_00865 [Intoshia linei]
MTICDINKKGENITIITFLKLFIGIGLFTLCVIVKNFTYAANYIIDCYDQYYGTYQNSLIPMMYVYISYGTISIITVISIPKIGFSRYQTHSNIQSERLKILLVELLICGKQDVRVVLFCGFKFKIRYYNIFSVMFGVILSDQITYLVTIFFKKFLLNFKANYLYRISGRPRPYFLSKCHTVANTCKINDYIGLVDTLSCGNSVKDEDRMSCQCGGGGIMIWAAFGKNGKS